MSGRISFIGAGPGAADLITVRGARRIAEADVVIWTASLVAPECVQEHARGDAELVDSSQLGHEQAMEIYRRAERERLNVARVHSGDPALWSEVQEQHDACARLDLQVEIVPGVQPFSAAAAAVGRELTVPEVAQSVVVTRLEGGKHPMPEREQVREFARHGTTMAVSLSASRTGQFVEELRQGGYPDDVPVLVAYKVSWPDEIVVRTTLGELAQTVKQHKLWRNTLFVVGRALSGAGLRARTYSGDQARTYPGDQVRSYRRVVSSARRTARGQREAGTRRSSSSAGVFDSSDPAPVLGKPAAPVRRGQADAAWWAVRTWQDSAQARAASIAVTRRAAIPEQPGLFASGSDQSGSPQSGSAQTSPTRTTPAQGERTPSDAVHADSAPDNAVVAGEAVPAVQEVAAVPEAAVSEKATQSTTQAAEGAAGGSTATEPAPAEVPSALAAQPPAGSAPQAAAEPEALVEIPPSGRTSSAERRTATTRASAKATSKTRAKGRTKTSGTKSSQTKRKTSKNEGDDQAG